ncbi:hypothetical protein MmiAt1_15940 [Methanimicrococcus sp. At1]|uniref:Uncharacterized protein n=1 Tax=Methanimicrococcus hacksteinii TaxID=3028293 RepID=A0ABU3VRG5_9EURY|nr:hypothetical protein [Methanimicrococcus sp. At1]MDV0445988.1 hypothetical protein [Methanimicrococcus sp. At1]
MARRTFSLSKKSGNQKTAVTFQRNKTKTNCVLNQTKIWIFEDGGHFELVQLSSKSKLELFKPLPLVVFYDGALYKIENHLFEISSSHKSFKKALEDMELQINALWDDFVLTDQFASGGLSLQKNILAYVREKKNDNPFKNG